ncbi:MAG TPA: PHB depolymerase family esterase [Paraburkholderia sp.]|jgi:poly(hydroxyalkanoate) depolymerase family esterase|nr:PHB depolymerase family esterase [Paraburkholderia sp.]
MKMTEDFLKSMKDAFDLLRTAGPKEATAAVQRALAGGMAHSAEAQARPEAGTTQPHQAPYTKLDTNEWAQAWKHTQAQAQPAEARADTARTPGTFTAHRFSNAAGERGYKLYMPAAQSTQPMPLVVMLHGCTQNADDFAAGTRMNELAEQFGVIVAYPNQSQAANHSGCWNWFKPADQRREQGEPSLIAGITREVMAQHPVDPARVYVAGLSAGGAMADVMLQTYPDLYAAAGVHSGLALGSAKDLPSALAAMKGGKARHARPRVAPQRPLIVFHGDADHTVHPSNAAELVAPFDTGTTISAPATAPAGKRKYSVQLLTSGTGVPAEFWSIHGAGHAWSGGSPRGSYTDAAGPDASAEMLRFFLAHPRG